MSLVTLLVFAVAVVGVGVMVSRGMRVVVTGGGIALLLVGSLLPWRLGDGGMASIAYLSAKGADAKSSSFALIFDAAGKNQLSYLPVLALLVAIAAAVLLLFGFLASMKQRDADEVAGPMIMVVMSGLCAALLFPLSVMAYRELRSISPMLDSPVGFACYLLFLLGLVMTFLGCIMTARALPFVPAQPWPHREF